MLEAAFAALQAVVAPTGLMMVTLGVGAGLLVGILPGLGGTVGMSLVLPFIYGMDPSAAIALLIGMVAVIHTADTFPSVLLGVPGSSGSQATIMDGYPLARKGEAGRALSAAFFASMAGGVVGAVCLFALLPVARPLVLALGSPELFMLAVLGLSTVGAVSGAGPLKGVAAGLLGLLIGTIGAAPATPVYRFTGNSIYLLDGLPLAVVALGLFALPEIFDLLIARTRIAEAAALKSGLGQGLRDVIRHRWLALRCSVIGVAVGFVPGLGGSVVDWISYGQAVQTSKDSSEFGEGDIRGVIAPESSNNAKEGGALIPTLLFGIPGSGTTAVLLGGLVLLGLEPGPTMLTANLDATLTVVWTLALANVLGTAACLLASKPVARLSLVPAVWLAPFLLIVMTAGAYQATRHVGDLLAFLLIGVFGWWMKSLGWPRPPVLIGFVLAASAERYLWISSARFGWQWLLDPLVLILGALTIALLVSGRRVRGASERSRVPADGASPPAETGAHEADDLDARRGRAHRLAFFGVVGAAFVGAALFSLNFPFRGRIFPLVIGCAGAFVVLLLWITSRREGAPADPRMGRIVPWVGWVLLLYVGTVVFGTVAAAGAFVALFLWRVAGARAITAVGSGVAVGLALWGLGSMLGLEWIEGLVVGGRPF